MKSEATIRKKLKEIEDQSEKLQKIYNEHPGLRSELVKRTIENGMLAGLIDWVLEDEE